MEKTNKKTKNPKKIFLSGAISGKEYDSAVADFLRCEKIIQERGDIAVVPVRLCSQSWSWDKCMRTCIKELAGCDGIYMLKGWKQSKGAKLEHFIALKLGMNIETEK